MQNGSQPVVLCGHIVDERLHLRRLVEVTAVQFNAERCQLVDAVSLRTVRTDHRLAAADEGARQVQADALSHAGDQDRIHGFRNSARVWMFFSKQPPSAVVLVREFESMTPRDLTQ